MKRLLALNLLFVMVLFAHAKRLENVKLGDISPDGWLKTMLERQRAGFANTLDTLVFPFDQGGWGAKPFTKIKNGKEVANWVPYEQTAYYYDGILRLGILLNDTVLVYKAKRAVYGSIAKASSDGVILSELASDGFGRWPHAVFFRAWQALYEETADRRLISALTKHFLADTIMLSGRDIVNTETMAWLYNITGDNKLFELIENTLLGVDGDFIDKDIRLFASKQRQDLHAVTFHELLKLPIIMHIVTGKQEYIDIARCGFKKLERYSMLPDGVTSSEEGVSGRGAQALHELCNVTDYMWTLSYMLRATGESLWADKMERALFNAGLGAITKKFDAHQYYTSPNQIFCDDYSCHNTAYTTSRMAFRQFHRPPCCTGNLNRMFPVYIGFQWLKADDNNLYKVLYGPGKYTHNVDGKKVILSEKSVYPYTDTITITVESGKAYFPFSLRIPGWCSSPSIKVNGKKCENIVSGSFYTITRTFSKGDCVEICFPKSPEYCVWDDESLVVNYGPMLFALPVEANVEKAYYKAQDRGQLHYGYKMTPASSWNYIIGSDGSDNRMIAVERNPIDYNDPWGQKVQPIQLKVPAFLYPRWKERYVKIEEEDTVFYAPVTPPLPPRGTMIYALGGLSPQVIRLVPYGATILRMSMFPFHNDTRLTPETLATE